MAAFISKKSSNLRENGFIIVFGVADYESGVKILKFKMEATKWRFL